MLDPRKILASQLGFGCVYECSCGMIYVSVGPVDLKFNRESFLEACEMLRDAVGQLEPLSPEAASQKHAAVNDSHLHSN
jgi:hypothetical protein